jgi:hypothetical protein
MGIWFGVLLTAILLKVRYVRMMPWYWILPFMIPILLDGGIQTIATMFGIVGVTVDAPIYISTNLIRYITGSIFGMGLGLVFAPMLIERSRQNKKLDTSSQFFRLVIIFLSLFIIYLASIQLWGLTSHTHEPEGLADNIVKVPSEDFFVRRAHAVCPADADDMINADCFFD